jgi:glycosyltransferase involved in cell wall biosynthesis
MKVVIVTKRTLAHGFGGVEGYVHHMARAIAALGHELVVLATAHPTRTTVTECEGYRVEYLAGTEPGVYSEAFWRASAAAVFRHRPYALLYSTNISGYGAAMAGVPGPHLVWSTGRMLTHLRSEWYDRAGVRARAGYPKAALALCYYAWLERRLHRRVDAIVAEDDRTYEALRRRGWPVRLLHTGVDTARFRPDPALRAETRASLGIPADGEVLLMAAAVNRQKGIALGVEAFLRLAVSRPRLHLVVVGDGPERRRLETTANARAAGARARFVGARPDASMPRYHAAADVLLYPTYRAEGVPRAILEAMASGVAVVATDRGGVGTAVWDGDTGVLLPRPSAALVESVVAGLLNDPARRRTLGERAVAAARQRFDLHMTATALLEAADATRNLLLGRA